MASLKYFSTLSILLILHSTLAMPPVIRIGAIFTENAESNSLTELAFKYAIHSINRNKGILPDTVLVPDIQYIEKQDSFHACKKVCAQISTGVQAIFGPSDSVLHTHIHSICDALDIPHLESRIDSDTLAKEFSINLYPSQYYVNQAFLDLIRYLNWTKVGILYEKDYGVIQLRELVRTPNLEVHVRQVNPKTYITVLNEMKNKEVNNLIVDTNAAKISIVLKSILQLQMNEYKYHYLFTSFDIETFDLEDFKYNFVNITSFRLVDIGDVGVKEILKDMEEFSKVHIKDKNHYRHSNDMSNNNQYLKRRNIETEPALIYDAVYIFSIGLQTLEQSHTLRISNVSCTDENPWDGGLSLINYINSVEWKGLTGPIQFKEGRRIQFKLDLVKLKQHSIVKVGEWSPTTRLNITDPSLFFDAGSMNVTLVVITILETPYVMMHYGKNFTGNERFYGFCVDILEMIANDVGFDYILDLVPDRKYGAKDPVTGEWNGMVAQLMKYKADLAVGSMTITYARESVIDFTKPFMNLGISILFKVPSTPPLRLFSFMNPLAFEIWIYVLAAYFLVSLTIFTVAKFSPFEWRDTNFCDLLNHNNAPNQSFTMANSFWFTIGTLMQQGSDSYPKAISTRIVSAIWWFFTLIIIASYTANLAAFLTVERMITPIENAEDLASQTEISYGTLESGSTMTFFRDSMIETYRKMWRSMDSRKPSAFTATYEEGIRRVNEGDYAFLMESTMLDYIVQRDCNLTQIGGLLDTKGYGIATPKGSPWRDKISLAILELQEKGDIQMLYDKWWKNTGETCVRKSNNKHSKASALGLDNIGGVFVVLLVGIAVAICVAVFEFWQHYRKQSEDSDKNYLLKTTVMQEKVSGLSCSQPSLQPVHQSTPPAHKCTQIPKQRSLCVEMLDELRYALRCLDSSKRPALKRGCPKCSGSEIDESGHSTQISAHQSTIRMDANASSEEKSNTFMGTQCASQTGDGYATANAETEAVPIGLTTSSTSINVMEDRNPCDLQLHLKSSELHPSNNPECPPSNPPLAATHQLILTNPQKPVVVFAAMKNVSHQSKGHCPHHPVHHPSQHYHQHYHPQQQQHYYYQLQQQQEIGELQQQKQQQDDYNLHQATPSSTDGPIH